MPPDLHESPDEAASARFYASLATEPQGALVLANWSGDSFWWVCNRCLGDEARKRPRHYADKAVAQAAADLHNEGHRGNR
jgi:hypothetical protein